MGSDNPSTDHVNDTMNRSIAEQQPSATEADVQKAFELRDNLRYVKNDTYVADPSLFLGTAFFERSGSDKLEQCPTMVRTKAADSSILTTPRTVSELVIDARLTASLDVLAFFSASCGRDEVYELRVVENYAARADTRCLEWDQALIDWAKHPQIKAVIASPDVTSLTIVIGVAQKYVTSKKYRKFEAGAKGGAFGINVGGKLYTSSSDFRVDVVYGLDLLSYWCRGTDFDTVSEQLLEAEAAVIDRAQITRRNEMFDRMAVEQKSILPPQ